MPPLTLIGRPCLSPTTRCKMFGRAPRHAATQPRSFLIPSSTIFKHWVGSQHSQGKTDEEYKKPGRGSSSPKSWATHRRRLIICCDGTWQASNKAEAAKRSNVAKLAQSVSPVAVGENGEEIPQIVYYQAGVGTSTAGNSTWLNWGFNLVRAALQGLGGYGLSENVIEAYYFIVSNWTPGTELFLFGFSRGAYTARALAGIVAELGVFHKQSLRDFPEAYRNYRELDTEAWAKYKSRVGEQERWVRDEEVQVKVLGCWDTVGNLGVPEHILTKLLKWNDPYKFHRVDLAHNVDHAFHALALEEHRKAYTPSLWHHPEDDDTPARLVQCWFPGMHTSVGGGDQRIWDTDHWKYRHSHDHELADVAFQWMCALCAPYLAFDTSVARRVESLSRQALVEGGWASDWWVRDSCRGVTGLGGSSTRRPGQYRLVPVNVPDEEHMADDTVERMHVSVRLRFGDKDPATWPASLQGFQLRWGRWKGEHEERWLWVKVLKGGRELVIPEAIFWKKEALGMDNVNERDWQERNIQKRAWTPWRSSETDPVD